MSYKLERFYHEKVISFVVYHLPALCLWCQPYLWYTFYLLSTYFILVGPSIFKNVLKHRTYHQFTYVLRITQQLVVLFLSNFFEHYWLFVKTKAFKFICHYFLSFTVTSFVELHHFVQVRAWPSITKLANQISIPIYKKHTYVASQIYD